MPRTETTASADVGPAAAPRYCRRCGYCLHALATPRCPECGQAFDPDNPRTTAALPRHVRLRAYARRAGWSALAVLCVVAAFGGWKVWRWSVHREVREVLLAEGAWEVGKGGHGWYDQVGIGWLDDKVEYVQVSAGGWTPKTIAALQRLESLAFLSVVNASLGDRDLQEIARMQTLEYLEFSGGTIDPRALQWLRSLPNLQGLGLYISTLSDTDVDALAQLGWVRGLDLSSSGLSTGAIERLRQAMPNTTITYGFGPDGQFPPMNMGISYTCSYPGRPTSQPAASQPTSPPSP